MSLEVNYPSIEGAQCPYDVYAYWQESAPVYQIPDHPNWYVVSRYEDILRILRTPELFSSVGSRGRMAQVDGNLGNTKRVEGLTMIDSDAPAHRPKRRLVSLMFTPGRLRGYEPVIRKLVDELIDAFIDEHEIEFISAFAAPLPVRVTSALFGIPREDENWIHEWGQLEASGFPWMPKDRQEHQVANGQRMSQYLRQMLIERVEQPRDDIYSKIIEEQIRVDGNLDLDYVLAQVGVITAGGVITTAHAVGSTMLLLLENPELMASIAGDHSRIPRMFEESIRLESPVQWVPRIVVQDTQIAGVDLPAGAHVLMMFGSANRDENQWTCPAQFDPDRSDVFDHLAFGNGEHYCLGAQLARLEGRVAFEQIFKRLTNIQLAAGNSFPHIPSPSFRGLKELHVTFDKA